MLSFKSIFVRYNVPYIGQGKTTEKEIDNTVRINEAHAHFTQGIPDIKLFEFMTTKRLRMEICGVLDDSFLQNVESSLFGLEESDKVLSKKLTPFDCHLNSGLHNSQIVTLAVACFDMSSLMVPIWNFVISEPCHNPDSFFFEKLENLYMCNKSDHVTSANINLKVLCKRRKESPLSQTILIERNTRLKVRAFLSAPLVNSIHAPLVNAIKTTRTSIFYARILVTLFHKQPAMSLLNDLLLRNQYINKEIVTKNPLHRTTKVTEVKTDWVTGFLIDNCKEFSFFLEGLEANITLIWKTFMHKSKDEIRIFYNSTYRFEKRLYVDFLPIGGIYTIILLKPLRDILAQQIMYVEGNVPIPCYKALKKLDLLYRCSTSKDMFQFSLFPTAEEIYSLDLEWGVPMHWKEDIKKKLRRGTVAAKYSP